MQVNDKKAAKKADDEAAALAAIAEMPEPDRAIGERLHASSQPARQPFAKTWYGIARVCQQGR